MIERAPELLAAALPLRAAYAAHINPGFYDLDAEQPVHVTMTKGEWEGLLWAIRKVVEA